MVELLKVQKLDASCLNKMTYSNNNLSPISWSVVYKKVRLVLYQQDSFKPVCVIGKLSSNHVLLSLQLVHDSAFLLLLISSY